MGDSPVGVDRAGDVHGHGRAERLPGMFLLARPVNADGATGKGARDQRCIGRRVVGPIVAVAAGTLDMDHADIHLVHAQHLCDGLAVGIDALGVRVDGQFLAVHERDGAGRADRSMDYVRPGKGGPEGALAAGQRRGALLGHGADLALHLAKAVVKAALLGQRPPLVPCRGGVERAHGQDRLILPLRHYREEVAVANSADYAGHLLDRGGVDRGERGAGARRADNAGMDHALGAQVLHVDRRAGDLGRDVYALNIGAHDAEVAMALQRHIGPRRNAEVKRRRQLAITHRPAVAVYCLALGA